MVYWVFVGLGSYRLSPCLELAQKGFVHYMVAAGYIFVAWGKWVSGSAELYFLWSFSAFLGAWCNIFGAINFLRDFGVRILVAADSTFQVGNLVVCVSFLLLSGCLARVGVKPEPVSPVRLGSWSACSLVHGVGLRNFCTSLSVMVKFCSGGSGNVCSVIYKFDHLPKEP